MFVKSENLVSPHAFSTRIGGVSALPHTSELNLAFGRGDEDHIVIKNLEIFAENAGFDAKKVISLPQIHSTIVHKVDSNDCGIGYYNRDFENCLIFEGDGYVTNDKSIILGVKSADCSPILFEAYDNDGNIIAIGATHAGWRGTVGKITKNCVDMLVSEYGAERKRIRACIGPCIHQCCFEVGDDVKDAVFSMGKDYEQYCAESGKGDGKYFCDIVGISTHVLINEAGLLEENVSHIPDCICCLPKKYYSHRYSKGQRGTMLSVIWMK